MSQGRGPARVHAALETPYRYKFEEIEVDEAARTLRIEGDLAAPRQAQLSALVLLLRHPNELVTYDQVGVEIRSDNRPHIHNTLSGLKKLLGAAGERITSVPKMGYRFDGDLVKIPVGTASPPMPRLTASYALPEHPHIVLQRQLAVGAATRSWLALDTERDQLVVIKFASGADGLSRLNREATVGAIVAKACGERQDLQRLTVRQVEQPPFYLISDYAGETLDDWVEQGRLQTLSAEQRSRLAARIAEAVAALHQAGVLHLDIKPANIALREAAGDLPHVTLIDYGSAVLTDAAALNSLEFPAHGLTVYGADNLRELSGTYMYAAPETIEGDPPTTQSDVHALGVLLYQLLSGRFDRPGEGWRQLVADEVLQEDIAAATDIDPGRRPATAAEFAAALRSLPQRREATAAKQLAAAREAELARYRQRRPFVIGIILLLALIGAGAAFFAEQQRTLRAAAEQSANEAQATTNYLQAMFRASDQRTSPDAAGNDLLEKAYALLDEQESISPEMHGNILASIADAQEGRAEYDAQATTLLRLAELQESMLGPESEDASVTRYKAALALARADKITQAEDLLAELDAPTVESMSERLQFFSAFVRAQMETTQLNFPAALALFDSVQAIQPSSAAERDVRHSFALGRAQALFRMNKLDEAQEVLMTVRGDTRAGLPRWRQALAQMMHATILYYANQLDAAEPALNEALLMHQAVYGDDHYTTGRVRAQLATLYATTDRRPEAEAELKTASRQICGSLGVEHSICLMVRSNLGMVQLSLGNAADGLTTLTDLRRLMPQAMPNSNASVMLLDYHIVQAHLHLDQTDAAAAVLQTLQPDLLRQASPDNAWPARLHALSRRILLQRDPSETNRSAMRDAINELVALGTDATEIDQMSRELRAHETTSAPQAQ